MKTDTIIATGASVTAGGVPQDLQDGIIQLVVGIVTGLLYKLFDRLSKKKK